MNMSRIPCGGDVAVRTSTFVLVLLGLVAFPVVASSQDTGEEEDPRANRLPEPLDEVSANFRDIEQSGFFKIVNAEHGRTDIDNDEALIWTLRVIKPLTARHATWVLRRFRDVRFYHTPEGSVQEVLCKLAYFSERISDEAINDEVLSRDDEFKMWVPLSAQEIRLLRGRRVDTAVFREFRK
jgi:hypothetical protein